MTSSKDLKMTDPNVKELSQFIGGYFHQDWNFEYESEEDAIASFRKESERRDVEAVVRGIDELLDRRVPDIELKRLLYNMGLSFDPIGADGTPSSWLRNIRKNLLETGS